MAEQVSLNQNSGNDPGRAAHPKPVRTEHERRLKRLKIMFPFLLLLVFFVWGFTTNFIPSESMEPLLKPGDHILTMKSWLAFPGGGTPGRGDVIIFQIPKKPEDIESGDPNTAGAAEGQKGGPLGLGKQPKNVDILVKRVVGLPGETVQISGNDVLINGRKLREDYPTLPLEAPEEAYFPYGVDQPIQLKPGELFVMGDNRNNSDDGRFWGALKRENVLGRFVRVLYHESEDGPNRQRAEESSGQTP